METLILSNFKFGLDTRRSELTSQPGTLLVCENAHINSGGEAEKRKGFFADPVLIPTPPCWGLEATKDGLLTFGSVPNPGVLPAGVGYQQLLHPFGLPNPPAMRRVIASCNFNGKAFVIAEYVNNDILLFYNGVLVAQSFDGTVEIDATAPADIAPFLADAINAIDGWTAIDQGDGSVLVQSPAGVYFSPVPEVTSEQGILGFKNIPPNDHAGNAGTSAIASFQITIAGLPGVDTYTVRAPKNQDGTGTIDLCTAVPSIGASPVNTALAICNSINDNTYLTGYSATCNGNQVFVYAPQDWGSEANGYQLAVLYTAGNIIAGGGGSGGALACNLSTTFNSVVKTVSLLFSDLIMASGVGGTAPYTYLWEQADPGNNSGNGIIIGSPTAASTYFRKILQAGQIVTGTFVCTVTDSLGSHARSSVLTIQLEESTKH